MLGFRIHMDPTVPLRSVLCCQFAFVEWLKHLRAGLLLFFKKKQSVECSADSQKVMQCLKAGGEGGGGGGGGGERRGATV